MKKLLIAILSALLCVAVLMGSISVYDSLNTGTSTQGISKLFGKREFIPEYDAYRIFDGVMMGEHNTDKTQNKFYSDSYYNQLAPNEKAVYNSVLNWNMTDSTVSAVLPEPVFFYSAADVPAEEEMASVSTYFSRVYQRALDALMMDGSSGFYLKMGKGGSVCRYEYHAVFKGERYVWCIDKIETEVVIKDCYKDNVYNYKALTEAAANSVITNGDTRYQRVKSIHDYVVSYASYHDTPYADDAYGVLVDKRATCSGFSRAFKLLCDKNNIPCALVTGVGLTQNESGEHMWCLVQMEDGLWYGVDPTWDDYGGSEYLLVGGDTVSSFSGLTFNESHIPSQDFTGFGYTPFVYPSLSDSAYLK